MQQHCCSLSIFETFHGLLQLYACPHPLPTSRANGTASWVQKRSCRALFSLHPAMVGNQEMAVHKLSAWFDHSSDFRTLHLTAARLKNRFLSSLLFVLLINISGRHTLDRPSFADRKSSNITVPSKAHTGKELFSPHSLCSRAKWASGTSYPVTTRTSSSNSSIWTSAKWGQFLVLPGTYLIGLIIRSSLTGGAPAMFTESVLSIVNNWKAMLAQFIFPVLRIALLFKAHFPT